MGLDMYAYRVRKLTDEELTEIEGRNVSNLGDEVLCIPEEDIAENEDGAFADLLPYIRQVNVAKTETDFDKIRRDYGVPDSWELYSYGYNGSATTLRFWGGNRNNVKEISISYQKSKEYERTRIVPCRAVHYVEVGYWRKEYDLEDALYEAYDGQIVNCGFHLANEKMQRLMLEHDAYFSPDDTVFYHEWY